MTPGPGARLKRAALPALCFGFLHAAAVAGIVTAEISRAEMALGQRALTVIAIFSAGSALAGISAWPLAHLVSAGRAASARFAALLVLLAPATAGFSALLYFLLLRAPHQGFGVFDLHTLYIGATAAFTYVASGLPLLLPFGLVLLLAECLAFARWSRVTRLR